MYVCTCVCMQDKAHEGRCMSRMGIMVTAGYGVSSGPDALVSCPFLTAWDPMQVPILYGLA